MKQFVLQPNAESFTGWRPGRKPVVTRTAAESPVIHCRRYSAPNWFTTEGVAKKRAEIEARGLPSMKDWRFITLTLNQERFAGPLEGYRDGKKHLRLYMQRCREAGLWDGSAKWCWKMEFQKNGWAHWHLLVNRTTAFTRAEMDTSSRLWGRGRVNHERVTDSEFLYSFKYAFKPVLAEQSQDPMEEAATVPAWFADYASFEEKSVSWYDADLVKHSGKFVMPVTMQRMRFWQTSKEFYTGAKPLAKVRKIKATLSMMVPQTVAEVAERAGKLVQVIARDGFGTYARSACVALAIASGALCVRASWHTLGGTGAFMAINSYVLPAVDLPRVTAPGSMPAVRALLAENYFTLRSALRLQRRGESLARC